MILINLCGGPCSGKSTVTGLLFAELKMIGVRAEMVGEAAKDIVYDGTTSLFENQILLTGMQYQRIHRLRRSGCEVAISDSPLIQGIMYAEDLPYYEELKALIRRVENQYRTYNVFLRRIAPYDEFGRYQKSEAEAKQFDPKVRKLVGPFWTEINGDRAGAMQLVTKVREDLL